MADISNSILQQVGIKSTSFSPSSRYYGSDTATMIGDNDEQVVYLKRRFIPQPENYFLLQEHSVKEGERLDNLTNQYYGDPEKFWQICDANSVLDPDELTDEPGNVIKITLPAGIPGNTNA